MIEIRSRRAADTARLVALVEVVHHSDGYPGVMPRGFEPFVVNPDALGAWVAVSEGGDIVGHVALHPRSSDAVMAVVRSVTDAPVGVVSRLFVHPTARRQAVGRRLLDTATAYAVSHGLVPILDVSTGFAPAIGLYEAAGWSCLGEVSVRFGDVDFPEYVYIYAPASDGPDGPDGPAAARRDRGEHDLPDV